MRVLGSGLWVLGHRSCVETVGLDRGRRSRVPAEYGSHSPFPAAPNAVPSDPMQDFRKLGRLAGCPGCDVAVHPQLTASMPVGERSALVAQLGAVGSLGQLRTSPRVADDRGPARLVAVPRALRSDRVASSRPISFSPSDLGYLLDGPSCSPALDSVASADSLYSHCGSQSCVTRGGMTMARTCHLPPTT